MTREKFIEELLKRGGETKEDSPLYKVKSINPPLLVCAIAGIDVGEMTSSVGTGFSLPYSAITEELMTAVAGKVTQ